MLSFVKVKGFLKFSMVAVAVAALLFFSFYQVDTAHKGVVTRFGAFSHISDEGPHFKIPFGVDRVFQVPVTRVHELQFGFRKGGESIDPETARQESLMLTGDLNVALVEWILQFRISEPQDYLFRVAQVEKSIRDVSISVMRRVVGDKLVSDVLTTDRVVIAEKARKLTQATLDHYRIGVEITKISLQNVTPPEIVKPAFNEINIAKQEMEQWINQAQEVYNKVIPEAEGKAAKLVSEAEAYAIELVNRAKGDSEKFARVYTAYKDSPVLTKKRLYLETMEELFKNAKKVTLVDEKIKGVLPIFSNNLPQGGG
ncbi:MAG: FtsH protease activity modulator HflK [Oligoflexales bacterium]|nr:FtsH protease activity modulator HflK [Oligoflexales bacterium]